MITLTINNVKYKAPQDWSEITLKKFIALCGIEIPEKLRLLWKASAGGNDKEYALVNDSIGVTELEKVFPVYYGHVITCLTTVPQDVVDMMHTALREQLFNKYLRHYVYSTFANMPLHLVNGDLEVYEPAAVKSFKVGGVEYMLPETLSVYGSDIPMGREQVITFAEASDIEIALRNMAEGAADRLPMFVAIYCRPKGEKYNEQAVIQRAAALNTLPMSTVWAVFFCIYRLLQKYQTSTQRFLEKVVVTAAGKLSKAG